MHHLPRLLLLVLVGVLGPALSTALPVPGEAGAIRAEGASPLPAATLPRIVVLRIEDHALHAATAEYLLDGIRHAEEAGADLVVLVLDTPGGLVTSTLQIVERMLSSEPPVVCFIAPQGAMAASGGFILTLAADAVAMAPGTTLGAASVVTITGQGGKEEGEIATGVRKAQSILAAQVRSMAERRGRPLDLAEKAVTESRAWSETEARQAGFADILAADLPALLGALEGREVRRFDGRVTVLRTAGAAIEEFPMTRRQRALAFLADPELLGILLMLGILGILVEFNHPGLVFPGVAGGLCLLIFAYGAQVLPISVVGVLFLLAAVVFFVLELKVTSHGLLGLGGIICLVLGGLMLFDAEVPELRINPWFIVPVAATAGALVLLLTVLAARSFLWKVTTGEEGLVGERGQAVTALDPRGKVFVHGAYWDAVSDVPVSTGGRVCVLRVDGLILRVRPEGEGAGGGSAPEPRSPRKEG